jgi:transcriptional regulator with XRE-family HTH domain
MAKDAERLAAQAQRIGELRAAKRVTQPEVADAVNVTLRAYQAWEAGDSDPKGPNIRALAKYFETTADYIEYGYTRERAPAPDLMDALPASPLVERLDRIELLVKEVLERLVAAEVLAAVEADKAQAPQPGHAKRPPRAA